MKKLKIFILSFTIFFLIGCAANKLNNNAAALINPDQKIPNGCVLVGQVDGSQGNLITQNFTSGENFDTGATNELRNNAAELGANYVQVVTAHADTNMFGGKMSTTNIGNAYKCSESTVIK